MKGSMYVKGFLIRGVILVSTILMFGLNHLSIWHLVLIIGFIAVTKDVEIRFNRKDLGWVMCFILLNVFSFYMNPPKQFGYEMVLAILRAVFYFSLFKIVTSMTAKNILYNIEDRLGKWQKIQFLITLVVALLIIYFPLILAFSPGNMYIDSYSQWGQAMGGIPLSDWHPVLTTLLMKISYKIIGTPVVYTLMQVMGSIMVLTYFSKQLLDLQLKRSYILLAVSTILFTTLLLSNMVTLYKDNLYNLSLVLVTLFLVRIYFIEPTWVQHWSSKIIFAFNFNVVLLGRHNGFYVGIAFLVIWLLFSFDKWKEVAMITCLTALIFMGYHTVLEQRYTIEPGSPSEKYSMVLQHIGAVVDAGKPLTEKQNEFLDQILPRATWQEKYTPVMIDPVKFHQDFNKEFINTHQKELLKNWLTIGQQYPLLYLRAELQQIRPLWDVNGWEHGLPGTQMFHYMINSPKAYYDPYLQYYDFAVEPLRDLIAEWSYQQAPHDGVHKPFITSVASVSILVLFACSFSVLFAKRWTYLLILLPSLLHLGTLCLAMPAYNIRYILAPVITSMMLAIIFKVVSTKY